MGQESDIKKPGISSHLENPSLLLILQRVSLLPKLKTKEHIFISRLVTFNETFASLSPSQPDYTVLWHEAVSGRSAPDVASAYIKVVQLTNSNHIYWCDNCSGQNKNWSLYTVFAQCVNQPWGPDLLRLKYLEKGHTFMMANNIHGLIGKKIKKTPLIADFNEFVELVNKSGKGIKPVKLHFSEIYEVEKKSRSRKSRGVDMPLLEDVVEVAFRKGNRALFYKTRFSEEWYTECDFLISKFDVKRFPGSKKEDRVITQKKKDGIVRCLKGVPRSTILDRIFGTNLIFAIFCIFLSKNPPSPHLQCCYMHFIASRGSPWEFSCKKQPCRRGEGDLFFIFMLFQYILSVIVV